MLFGHSLHFPLLLGRQVIWQTNRL